LECVIVPHRKIHSGVAKNFIKHSAQFDRLKKESMNTVCEGEVLAELGRAFPNDVPTSEAFPLGWVGVVGLVLVDTRGEGSLQ
jgi:hypothetical protein